MSRSSMSASDLRMSMPSSPQRGSITRRRSTNRATGASTFFRRPTTPRASSSTRPTLGRRRRRAQGDRALSRLACGRRRHDGRAASRRADERTPARMSNDFSPFSIARLPRIEFGSGALEKAARHRCRLRPASAARHRRAFVCRIGSRERGCSRASCAPALLGAGQGVRRAVAGVRRCDRRRPAGTPFDAVVGIGGGSASMRPRRSPACCGRATR
jgi:hypothetical protein